MSPHVVEEILTAVDSSSCGITLVDLEQPDEPLVYVNDAFCEMTGYLRGDVIGRNCRFLQGEERRQSGVDRVRQAVRGRIVETVELLNFQSDGTSFWNELHIGPSKNPRFFFGIQTDITARKEAEQQADALRSSLRKFSYAVAHDLHAPLRHLRDWSGSLVDDVQNLPPKAVEYCDQIEASVTALGEQISGLLAHARASLADREAEPVDMDAAARGAMTLLGFPKELPPGLEIAPLPPVVGYRARVVQLLQNLIGNALQHGGSESGGSRVRVYARRDGDEHTYVVADEGPGIEPRLRARLFDPFRTGASARAGHGLGLASCQEVAVEHGGRIWIEDNQPRGTRFCFVLQDQPLAR